MVRVVTQITPRYALAHVILPLLGRKAVRDVMRYCEAAVALRRSDSASPIRAPMPDHPVSHTHLRVRLQQLAQMPIQQDLMAPLQRHLQEGTDEEVLRMQPMRWQRPGTAHRGKSCGCFSPTKSASSR